MSEEQPPQEGHNSRYLEEARQIEARWSRLGLLLPTNRQFDRQATAVLLESQRLINEQPVGEVGQFRRISIPLVRRIYPQLICNPEANKKHRYHPPEKVNWLEDGF